jgi:hypothetical protein
MDDQARGASYSCQRELHGIVSTNVIPPLAIAAGKEVAYGFCAIGGGVTTQRADVCGDLRQ